MAGVECPALPREVAAHVCAFLPSPSDLCALLQTNKAWRVAARDHLAHARSLCASLALDGDEDEDDDNADDAPADPNEVAQAKALALYAALRHARGLSRLRVLGPSSGNREWPVTEPDHARVLDVVRTGLALPACATLRDVELVGWDVSWTDLLAAAGGRDHDHDGDHDGDGDALMLAEEREEATSQHLHDKANELLAAVCCKLPLLRRLRLELGVGALDIAQLADHVPRLTHLSLFQHPCELMLLRTNHLSRLHQLEVLELPACVDDAVAGALGSACTRLRVFRASGPLTDAGILALLRARPPLEGVGLSSCANVRLCDEVLRELVRFPLTFLDLSGVHSAMSEDVICALLCGLHELRVLDLSCCATVSNAVLANSLPNLPHLHSLFLDFCPNISSPFFDSLARHAHPALANLSFWLTPFNRAFPRYGVDTARVDSLAVADPRFKSFCAATQACGLCEWVMSDAMREQVIQAWVWDGVLVKAQPCEPQ